MLHVRGTWHTIHTLLTARLQHAHEWMHVDVTQTGIAAAGSSADTSKRHATHVACSFITEQAPRSTAAGKLRHTHREQQRITCHVCE